MPAALSFLLPPFASSSRVCDDDALSTAATNGHASSLATRGPRNAGLARESASERASARSLAAAAAAAVPLPSLLLLLRNATAAARGSSRPAVNHPPHSAQNSLRTNLAQSTDRKKDSKRELSTGRGKRGPRGPTPTVKEGGEEEDGGEGERTSATGRAGARAAAALLPPPSPPPENASISAAWSPAGHPPSGQAASKKNGDEVEADVGGTSSTPPRSPEGAHSQKALTLLGGSGSFEGPPPPPPFSARGRARARRDPRARPEASEEEGEEGEEEEEEGEEEGEVATNRASGGEVRCKSHGPAAARECWRLDVSETAADTNGSEGEEPSPSEPERAAVVELAYAAGPAGECQCQSLKVRCPASATRSRKRRESANDAASHSARTPFFGAPLAPSPSLFRSFSF